MAFLPAGPGRIYPSLLDITKLFPQVKTLLKSQIWVGKIELKDLCVASIIYLREGQINLFLKQFVLSHSLGKKNAFSLENFSLQGHRSARLGSGYFRENPGEFASYFCSGKNCIQWGPVGIRPCSIAGGRQKLSDTFGKMWEKRKVTFVMRKIAYGVGERKNGQAPQWSARPFQASV